MPGDYYAMTFEEAFIAMVAAGSGIPVAQIAWGQAPLGQPAAGAPQIVLRNAPGGDRELTHSGVSSEMGRMIQVSIFGLAVLDARNAAEALHAIDGFQGSLDDGSLIWAVAPAMQDVDGYDNTEKLFQTVFNWIVRMRRN